MQQGEKQKTVKHKRIMPKKPVKAPVIEKPIEVETPIKVENWPQPANAPIEVGYGESTN